MIIIASIEYTLYLKRGGIVPFPAGKFEYEDRHPFGIRPVRRPRRLQMAIRRLVV